MRKKYLLHYDEERATVALGLSEQFLVAPINTLVASLMDAGVTEISKETIAEIFKNEMEAIESLIPQPNGDILNQGVLELLKRERETKVANVWNAFCKIAFETNTLWDGTPTNSDEALAMLLFDENGHCCLTEEARASISENFKQYIQTPIGCELYEIQHQLAKLMQTFHNKLVEAENIPNKTLSIGAKSVLAHLFPLGAFYFKRLDNDKIEITPKVINFDPETF